MRYNEKDVAYFARSSRGRDREGILQKKGEANPAFKSRWFVLKGNLLFYFHNKTDNEPVGFILLENCRVSEATDEFCEFGISIAFGTPISRSYLLIAADRDDMLGWLKAIQEASLFRMREKTVQLMAEIEQLRKYVPPAVVMELTVSTKSTLLGEDEAYIPTGQRISEDSSVIRNMPMDDDDDDDFGDGNDNDEDDDEDGIVGSPPVPASVFANLMTGRGATRQAMPFPNSVPPPTAAISTPVTAPVFSELDTNNQQDGVLDVAFTAVVDRGNEIKDTFETMEFQIIVSRLDTSLNDWNVVGRTEVAEAEEKITSRQLYNTEFLVSVQLFQVTEQQQYKFSLYRIEDVENDRVRLWGDAFASSADLLALKTSTLRPAFPLKMDDKNPDAVESTGYLNFRLADPIGPDPVKVVGSFNTCPVTGVHFEYQQQTYRLLSESGRALKVRESISESVWTFLVPTRYLKYLESEEKSLIRDLDGLSGSVHQNVEPIRKRQVELHCRLVLAFQNVLSYFGSYSGKSFRPSTSKKGEELQFVALNCHVQQLVVSDGQGPFDNVYDTVTFGAACAHGYGFKKGGMKSLLEAQLATTTKTSSDEEKTPMDMKDSRSASILSGMIQNISSRLIATKTFKRDASSQPTLSTAPSLFFNSSGSSSLTLSSLGQEEPPTPASVLMPYQDSSRCMRTTALEVASAFTRSTEELLNASRLIDKSERVPAIEKARNALYGAVHFMLSQTGRLEAMIDQEPRILANKINQTSLPALYTAVQNVADGSSGPAGLEALNSALDVVVRSFERLSYLVLIELSSNYVREDAATFSQVSLRLRLAAIQSQALTALVSIFASNLNNRMNDDAYLQQLSKAGYLAHFESLLSTLSDEMGMLEDMYVAVRELSTVRIRLAEEDLSYSTSNRVSGHIIEFQGTPDATIIVFFLPTIAFDLLPQELKDGELIKIYPVFFTHGINEAQTYANHLGDTALQDRINSQSFALLRLYFKEYRLWVKDTKLLTAKFIETRTRLLEDSFKDLKSAISNSKRSKNPDVHILAERITRLMNGGRLTSCKSAKDRTSMAVTLEQVLILKNNHKLSADQIDPTRDALRSHGVRLQNAKKNTGTARYAFNYLQTMALPKLYRPPRGTAGGGVA